MLSRLFAIMAIAIVFFISCKSSTTKTGETGLYLPDDLEATLWAESPMLYNPTNMDADVKGRIWVTEAVNYRNFNNDSTKFFHRNSGDRVMILEDTDQDGKADSAKVFVEDPDLRSPVGIAVIGNKVIISCSPNMIVYTDENGDDLPDKKEVLLTGFGGFDHDHSLHAVYAGPDGKWYFNVGNAGPHKVTDKSGWTLRSGSIYTGGSPYNTINEGNQRSDDGKVWVGGLALRVNNNGTGLKVMGHNFRNSYEVIPDSYGNLWQNDNDDQVLTCRTSWLMEGGNAGYFSTDGTRYWQADQRPGQDMFTAHWHQEDPGVMPAGDCTGAGAPTGITMMESEALGKQYLGMLLSADAGRNVVFAYKPAVDKSGYKLGERRNLITSLSNDNVKYVWNDSSNNVQKEKWFRPSDVTIGTDGAIYIADWYDPVVGGHQMKDSIGYGRIYRIAPKNKKLANPRIDLTTVNGQLEALRSPAINVRQSGFEKLKSGGEASIGVIKPLLADSNPFIKARAIWLMAHLGERGITEAEKLLNDNNELVRATAFRALRETNRANEAAKLLINDNSSFVRREIAVYLRDLPVEQKRDLVIALSLQYDGQDRWYLESLGAAMDGPDAIRSQWYTLLKSKLTDSNQSIKADRTMLLKTFAWRLHSSNTINDLQGWMNEAGATEEERKKMLVALAFVNDKTAANTMLSFTKSPSQNLREQAIYWLSFRQANEWSDLLNWSSLSMNTAYERKLSEMKVKRQILLDDHQSNDERSWRTEEMAADSIGGQMLIGLASEKKIPAFLLPVIERAIFKNPSPAVRIQAANYFKRPGVGKTYSIESIAKMPGDAEEGRKVFNNKCMTCHKAGSMGNNIGPDLSLINKKFDRKSLLDAIMNPDGAIVFGYEAWLINKKDGESLYGFILSENKQNIVLKDIAGEKHTVKLADISKKEKQDKSLMPDPVANGLSEQDLANVAEFLLRLRTPGQ